MNFYDETKFSGMRWIGSIPNHWNTISLKYLVKINQRALTEKTEKRYKLKYIDISNVNHLGIINSLQQMEFADAPSRARRVIKKFDTIISTVRTYLKAIAFIDSDEKNLIASTGFATLSPENLLVPKFLYYLVSCQGFVDEVSARSVGVSYPAITSTELANIPICVPTIDEQKSIIAFLDKKTSLIDELIAKKEHQLKVINEHRKALINQIITKGLNPDVLMKNSVVEWTDEIPNNWKLVQNGFLFDPRDEKGFPEFPLLNVSIHTGVTIRSFSTDRVEQVASDWSIYKKAEKGDIAFNKMRMWQGAVGVVPETGLVSPDYIVAKPKSGVNSKYFEYLFRTEGYKTEINRNSHGIVPDRHRLYWDDFKQLKSLCPPIDEQNMITDYLESCTQKNDLLCKKIENQIELLSEYRITLITAAVTGKIDVREQE